MGSVTNFMDELDGEQAEKAGESCLQVAGKSTKDLSGKKVCSMFPVHFYHYYHLLLALQIKYKEN